MSLEATKVKTHETVWSGVLTPAQLSELLVKGLREQLGTPWNGMSLTVVRVEPAAEGGLLPVIHYDLVHDHEWYMRKVEPDEAPVETA